MLTLDASKKWFQSNVDAILRIYGYRHQIQKEDLFLSRSLLYDAPFYAPNDFHIPLVIGTLHTPAYALLVSHHHPEGHVSSSFHHLLYQPSHPLQALFNVYANPQVGQPWGTFTTDKEINGQGPSYDDPDDIPAHPVISKISNHGDPMSAVLLARLRFKPDVLEPTSK